MKNASLFDCGDGGRAAVYGLEKGSYHVKKHPPQSPKRGQKEEMTKTRP